MLQMTDEELEKIKHEEDKAILTKMDDAKKQFDLICDENCTNHINNYINERDEVLHEKLILINNELDEIEEKIIEAKLKKRIEKRETK